jgi:hypothetical protein
MSAAHTVRDESDVFELEALAFGARHKDSDDLLFVVEAVSEQVARERVEEIASEFFGLDGAALVLVLLEKAVNAVPNFLEGFFQSLAGGNSGATNQPVVSRTLH